MMKSIDFLQSCIDIQEERGAEYENGSAERSFEAVATAFSAITGTEITPAEVALLLQILKDVRQWTQDRYHADSVLDGVSYASLKAECLYNQYNKPVAADNIPTEILYKFPSAAAEILYNNMYRKEYD